VTGTARAALLVLAMLVRAAAPAIAQDGAPGAATIEVSPREATVGDPLATTIVVDAPAGASIEDGVLGPDIGSFRVLSGAWAKGEPAAGRARWTWTGSLAAYETGDLTLPPIEIRLVTEGTIAVVRTGAAPIRIRSVLPPEEAGASGEEAKPADLKPPASIEPDFTVLKKALAVVGLLLVLALAAWWLHRRYASRFAAVPAPTDPFHRVPPHVWVYEELKRLLDRRLAEEGNVDLFFSELSRIVKQYLSGRYRVDLMERTTEEVPPPLQQAGAPPDAVRAARALLERCDLVKFAKLRPDAARCRAEVEDAYRIVDATRPAEPALAVEAGRGAA
jgi:hypothetical protein